MRLASIIAALAICAACGSALDADPAPVPVEPSELHAWLEEGAYSGWSSESEVLPGEHGGGRRIYLNDAAMQGLEGGGPQPRGATAVRELFESDLHTHRGWAVLTKVGDEGGADDWFFYETFRPDDPSGYSIASAGAPGCAGCHAAAPDFVQTSLPLH